MLCKDIMRRPVEFAKRRENVRTAARKMRDANIGFLPVCDDSGRVVGVLTDRDIAVRLCAEGGSPSDTAVDEIMTRRVVHCRPSDDLHEAERLMSEHKTSRVIVATEDGRLTGVISLSDVALRTGAEGADTLRRVASREVLGSSGARPNRRPRR